MGRFISLFESGRPLGQFDLPDVVVGNTGYQFRLINAVGGGGNGVVFRARPLGPLGEEIDHCAIKLLRQQDVTRRDRFANEARIMQRLDHARVAQFFDEGEVIVGSSVHVPWLAMELGERNLREHVQRFGPLPPDRLITVAVQMCEAVNHLHDRGIIHRDLKPDNFVWDGEDEDAVKMIDFGIAKLVGEDVSGRPLDQFTKQMEFVGPVFFSSPELIAYSQDKSQPVDQRSDLFQLGKTIWFLACARISAGVPAKRLCPFGGNLHAIVEALLQDDPVDRIQSVAEVQAALGALAA